MQPQLSLIYYDDDEQLTRVQLTSRRFTIGRDLNNDLVMNQSSLSHYHAVIEQFDNTFRISDCGSRNGTFVNGNRIQLPVELSDGDVINLAEVCEIEVELKNDQISPQVNSEWSNESPPLSHEAMRTLDRNLTARSVPRVKTNNRKGIGHGGTGLLDLRIILGAVMLLILVLVMVAIALKSSDPNRKSSDDRSSSASRVTPEVLPSRAPDSASAHHPPPAESASVTPSRNELDDELDEVEKNTLTVMRAISLSDSSPVLDEAHTREIYERIIKSYKGSTTLRDNFRLMKNGIPQLDAAAKAKRVKMPLLVFAALARVDKDGRGDPVFAAGGLIPELARNQVFLAKDMAHDNLLAFAATDPSSGGGMALRDAIAAASKSRNQNVQTIRNVWYLRDIGVLKPSAFDLVIRFLAIGAIAQNPRHYGIDADRLSF